jgi:serine/threonine-protein kinase
MSKPSSDASSSQETLRVGAPGGGETLFVSSGAERDAADGRPPAGGTLAFEGATNALREDDGRGTSPVRGGQGDTIAATALMDADAVRPGPTPGPVNATISNGLVQTSPAEAYPTHGGARTEGFQLGERFQGKYEIVRLLGVGGMGRVYQARHLDLDTMVAIKVLSSALNRDHDAIERFKREARAMAKIQHPNAVRVIDYGVGDENCYLVMEFLEGESLRDRLQKRGRLPVAETVKYAEQVFYALEFMHRKGITHRDLKPDNIFLQQDDGLEVVKVLDFGIAKVQTATAVNSNLTRDGMMIGTPRYMSPEQCQGQAVDGRSDLYSFGVVLYEMLSGTVPFDDENPFVTALKHINNPLPPLHAVAPDLAPEIVATIHKALAKPAAERHQSAKEFAQALLAAANMTPALNMPMLDAETTTNELTPVATPTKDAPTDRKGGRKGGTVPYGKAVSVVTDEGGGARSKPWLTYAAAGVVGVGLLFGALKVTGVLPGGESVPPKTEPTAAMTSGPVAASALTEFILIPGGEFVMGADEGDGDVKPEKDESPAHAEKVAPFYIGRYEVTNAEYKKFVDAKAYAPPKHWKNGAYDPGTDEFPVTNVSWQDAAAYCEWLSEKEGVAFRLPTEAEWEYAARGADKRMYPWGDYKRDNIANTNQYKEDAKGQTLLARVTEPPNNVTDKSAFGVFGMGGNVCEWTASNFAAYAGSKYSPTPKDLECKVYRGGNFSSPLSQARTTSRKWNVPSLTRDDLGFRVAATPPQK